MKKGSKHSSESLEKMQLAHSTITEETRSKMRLSQSNRSMETRRRMSLSLKGKTPWNKGLTREIDNRLAKCGWPKGKHRPEETRKKNSESHKGQICWCKGLTKETNPSLRRISEKMKLHNSAKSEEARKKISQKRLSRVYPIKDTKIEVALQKGLDELGIQYEKHIPVCEVCQPDIIFSEKKVTVFADGDYWHNLPSYKIRDTKQNKILEENGWKVLRFWEHEIKNDLLFCIDKIVKEIY